MYFFGSIGSMRSHGSNQDSISSTWSGLGATKYVWNNLRRE